MSPTQIDERTAYPLTDAMFLLVSKSDEVTTT